MKKIIGIIHPFDLYQFFYVYEDGNKLDITKTTIDKIPQVIFTFSKIYDTYQVDLSGSQHFTKGIANQIQEAEIAKYGENKLIIKCI